MKSLIVLACVLAVASAGHLFGGHAGVVGLAGHGGFAGHVGPAYAGPLHLPVINGEGVPVDTADVQHARAAHLSQQATVVARNGDYAHGDGYDGHGYFGPGVAVAGPAAFAGHAAVAAAAFAGHGAAHAVPAAYPTSHVAPAIANGVPLNTPEVAAAAANHLAAHHEALARTAQAAHAANAAAHAAAHGAHGGHYRKRRGIYAGHGLGLGLGLNAAAFHGGLLAGAHGSLLAGGHGYAAPQPAYHGPIHLPVINGEGVPVDTADVQHARAAHLTHVATVQHRNGDFAHGGYGGYDGYGYGGHGGYGGYGGHGHY